LWVTTSAKPLEQGLPAKVLEVVKTEASARTKEQADTLTAYYRSQDMELRKREQTLYTSKLPLPTDPKLIALRATLAKANEPIKIEPKLIQLRLDVAASTKQADNQR